MHLDSISTAIKMKNPLPMQRQKKLTSPHKICLLLYSPVNKSCPSRLGSISPFCSKSNPTFYIDVQSFAAVEVTLNLISEIRRRGGVFVSNHASMIIAQSEVADTDTFGSPHGNTTSSQTPTAFETTDFQDLQPTVEIEHMSLLTKHLYISVAGFYDSGEVDAIVYAPDRSAPKLAIGRSDSRSTAFIPRRIRKIKPYRLIV